MTLDKAIKHNKEHRKPYRGAKDADKNCRNHGSCPYCQQNRHYHDNVQKVTDKEQKDEEKTQA